MANSSSICSEKNHDAIIHIWPVLGLGIYDDDEMMELSMSIDLNDSDDCEQHRFSSK